MFKTEKSLHMWEIKEVVKGINEVQKKVLTIRKKKYLNSSGHIMKNDGLREFRVYQEKQEKTTSNFQNKWIEQVTQSVWGRGHIKKQNKGNCGEPWLLCHKAIWYREREREHSKISP